MSARVIVAGIGNVFLGDDGFGVEVARRLAGRSWPAEVTVMDVGIRALHLAFALLDAPSLLLVADAVRRDAAPGTLYLIEPAAVAARDVAPQMADAHGMSVEGVFAALRALGGVPPRTMIVGCEPASLDEGMGLSPAVQAAVDGAAGMIARQVHKELGGTATSAAKETTT
jgi:hydrogenase maturation protease